MFHVSEILAFLDGQAMRNYSPVSVLVDLKKSERPDLRPAFAVMRLNTPSPRRSEGRCDQLGALSEPHREQNLYANPKRTAKSNFVTALSDASTWKKVQTIFKILTRRADKTIINLITVWLQVKNQTDRNKSWWIFVKR
jgi:hypothetical protein